MLPVMTPLLKTNRENQPIQQCDLNLHRNLLIVTEKKGRLSLVGISLVGTGQ